MMFSVSANGQSQDIRLLNSGNDLYCDDDDDNGCPITLWTESEEANLGVFFIGKRISDLPSYGGNSDRLSFFVFGGKKDNYSITTTTTTSLSKGRGNVNLKKYSWIVQSKNHNLTIQNQDVNLSNVKLKKPNNNEKCKYYAKFVIKIEEVFLERAADPGDYQFDVTITVSVDI